MPERPFDGWKRGAKREELGACMCGGPIVLFYQPWGQWPTQDTIRHCVCVECGLIYDEDVVRQRKASTDK